MKISTMNRESFLPFPKERKTVDSEPFAAAQLESNHWQNGRQALPLSWPLSVLFDFGWYPVADSEYYISNKTLSRSDSSPAYIVHLLFIRPHWKSEVGVSQTTRTLTTRNTPGRGRELTRNTLKSWV
jgi:hypothetical protein